jgi:hypothetical protein
MDPITAQSKTFTREATIEHITWYHMLIVTITLRKPTLNKQSPGAGTELASSGRTIDKQERARSQTCWKAEEHVTA